MRFFPRNFFSTFFVPFIPYAHRLNKPKGQMDHLCSEIRALDFESDMHTANYFFWNNLRHVVPYEYTFRASAKQRWFGKNILSVLASEFRQFSSEYFEKSLLQGTILVRDEIVGMDYIIKQNDWITHTVHRHEPAVLADAINVVDETDELIVVNKPPSIPVHACGRYRMNSMVCIVGKELNIRPFPIHRIDKLTSGLLVLAKSSEIATRYMNLIATRNMSKIYYARVLGEFPPESVTVEMPLLLKRENGQVAVVNQSNLGGKTAKTLFKRVSYNGHSSVVECHPITGRTHQIRIHLQSIGYPIANDHQYGGRSVLSNTYSVKGGVQKVLPPLVANAKPLQEKIIAAFDARKLYNLDAYHRSRVESCSFCKIPYLDSETRYPAFIWLHAFRYTCDLFDFQVPLPDWTTPDFDSVTAMQGDDIVKVVFDAME